MALGSLQEIVIETSNPEALARFWQALIGGDVDVDGDEWASLESDDVYLVFLYSDERPPSTPAMRMSVEVDDLAEAVDQAEQLGAAKKGALVEDDDGSIQQMIDPGGHLFAFIG